MCFYTHSESDLIVLSQYNILSHNYIIKEYTIKGLKLKFVI